jgi:hypothetical protein
MGQDLQSMKKLEDREVNGRKNETGSKAEERFIHSFILDLK